MTAGTRKRRSRRTRRGPSILGVLGVLLIIGGLVAIGWVGWQYWGTNITSRQAFDEETRGLRDAWQDPAAEPADGPRIPGDAIALLRIPAFGDDYEVPILWGIDDPTLERGVGMYPSAVMPGEIGNFSVAGHRVTRGEPFRRLLELQTGDEVIVETRDAIHTYAINTTPTELTVQDTESWVLDPVPGKPDQEPTESIVTLTTCQDLFRSPDRSVAFGHLISTQPK
ncbi:MAG: class E sortase [Propionibacterium sp.]|nr:class E sortase [Propionibacterium sp.]